MILLSQQLGELILVSCNQQLKKLNIYLFIIIIIWHYNIYS
jgi:hypothetical protein